MAAQVLSVEIEEDLVNLVRWFRYTYIVQRPVAWVDATIPATRALGDWMDQLPPETDAVEPGKFTTIAEFRGFHENIIQYLSIVKSTAGFPLIHLIHDNVLPADDPGYGLPSFDE